MEQFEIISLRTNIKYENVFKSKIWMEISNIKRSPISFKFNRKVNRTKCLKFILLTIFSYSASLNT